jgi:threonine/homoserine/homoserine lactone efflux protein
MPEVGIGHLAAFLGVALVVIVTPGQDTALTIRNTLTGGRRGGVLTALGVASGQVTWAIAASAGLSAVLLASKPLFTGLRIAGAAYLVFLGAEALLAAVRGRPVVAGEPRRRATYRQGLLSNLGNPKMVVFFTSLLPQFASSFGGMLSLGLVFAAITLTWLTLYAFAVARAKAVLLRTRCAARSTPSRACARLGVRLATEASPARARARPDQPGALERLQMAWEVWWALVLGFLLSGIAGLGAAHADGTGARRARAALALAGDGIRRGVVVVQLRGGRDREVGLSEGREPRRGDGLPVRVDEPRLRDRDRDLGLPRVAVHGCGVRRRADPHRAGVDRGRAARLAAEGGAHAGACLGGRASTRTTRPAARLGFAGGVAGVAHNFLHDWKIWKEIIVAS